MTFTGNYQVYISKVKWFIFFSKGKQSNTINLQKRMYSVAVENDTPGESYVDLNIRIFFN